MKLMRKEVNKMESIHKPVMLPEAIRLLNVKPRGTYVDMTLGRAGHSKAILEKLDRDGLLIGIDQDDEAIKYSKEMLSRYATNYEVVKANFRQIDDVLKELNITKVDGF